MLRQLRKRQREIVALQDATKKWPNAKLRSSEPLKPLREYSGLS